jgi:hypothetical protein
VQLYSAGGQGTINFNTTRRTSCEVTCQKFSICAAARGLECRNSHAVLFPLATLECM